MSAFLIALVIVGWCAALGYAGWRWTEGEDWRWSIGVGALVLLALWAVIAGLQSDEESGPCLRKETGYTYNAATKTVMPYTYCAQRGEWVE